jgi:hypothetical protein
MILYLLIRFATGLELFWVIKELFGKPGYRLMQILQRQRLRISQRECERFVTFAAKNGHLKG